MVLGLPRPESCLSCGAAGGSPADSLIQAPSSPPSVHLKRPQQSAGRSLEPVLGSQQSELLLLDSFKAASQLLPRALLP